MQKYIVSIIVNGAEMFHLVASYASLDDAQGQAEALRARVAREKPNDTVTATVAEHEED